MLKSKIFWILVIALLIRLILSFGSWHPDLNNHVDWGERFFEYGPQLFYAPSSNVWDYTWPNQPPGTILIFAAIRKLFEVIFALLTWVNNSIPAFPSNIMFFLEDNLYQALLKLPAVLADLGIASIIYLILKEKRSVLARVGAAIYLFNPVVIYNSSIWGQTDSIINFFFFLGFYMLMKKRLLFSFIFVALSLYIKVSLAIFIPIFLIVVLKQKHKWSSVVTAALVTGIFFSIVTLIFSYPQNPILWLVNIFQEKVLTQQLHVITANGFNFWAALTGIHEQPNTLFWGPLTYALWGQLLFAIAYIPLLVILFKSKGSKTIWWVLALASFASFVLLTNMHERYLYPLFPYITLLVCFYPKIWIEYLAISAIHLLNLYNFWWVPRIEGVVNFLSFSDRLMPRILGVVMTFLFLRIYISFVSFSRQAKL